MQHNKTQQLEFTPETIQNIKLFGQSVDTLKELLSQKIYLDLIRNDIDRVISRLEILEEREEREVLKQCAWCKALYNIHSKQWEQVPAEILPDAIHGICPECVEKFKVISERRQVNNE